MKKNILSLAAIGLVSAFLVWTLQSPDRTGGPLPAKDASAQASVPEPTRMALAPQLNPVEAPVPIASAAAEEATSSVESHQHSPANCSNCKTHGQPTVAAGAEKGKSMLVDDAWVAEVFKGGEGTEIAFTLPDGRDFKGTVQFARKDGDTITAVNGVVTAPAAGGFFFVRNESPGKAGPVSGWIQQPATADGYKLVATGPTSMPELAACPLGDIVCHVPAEGRVGIPEVEGVAKPTPRVGPLAAIIKLESRPGAKGVLYIDFDGEKGPFPGWGPGGTVGNFDAEAPEVTDAEVTEVWSRVVEDYKPFNINVTTDLDVFLAAPVTSRIQIILTPTNDAAPGAGGVAYLDSWNWGTGDISKVCWGFYAVGKTAGEIVSHEVGHTFNLRHDGTTDPDEEYYEGQGTGEVGWAPIMGVGYRKNLVQWSKGEYKNPTRANEDDLAIIESGNNTDYLTDDHGATAVNGTKITLGAGENPIPFSAKGVISTTPDVDGFVIDLGAGPLKVDCTPHPLAPNLDILLEVVNSSGTVIATSNPDTELAASLETTVSSGTYLIRVSGVGRGDPLVDGYTDYGSLGEFTLSGTGYKDTRPPPGADDHGNTFSVSTSIAVPELIDGNLELAGDVDFFSFTLATAGTYTFQSVGTTDVKGFLYSSRYALMSSNDDSGGARNFLIRRSLAAGKYYFMVQASNRVSTGKYQVNFGGATGTTVTAPALVNVSFGTIVPGTTKTQVLSIQNPSSSKLLLTGSPVVGVSGNNPALFEILDTPATSILPGTTATFSVIYKPDAAGLHTAKLTIPTSDPARNPLVFNLDGQSDPVVGQFANAPLVSVSAPATGSLTTESNAVVYRVQIDNDGSYVLESTGAVDTFGQLYSSVGTLIDQNDDDGSATNFRIVRFLARGSYFLRVSARTSGATGNYGVNIAFETLVPEIELTGPSGTAIASGHTTPVLAEGTHFGTLNAAAGYLNRSFVISNVGQGQLALTGSSPVSITGTGASHFSLVQQLPGMLGSGGRTPLVIRFNPAFAGSHSATITIQNNDGDESAYSFTVSGVGIGLPDDHESRFAGASVMYVGADMPGILERGGDVDLLKFRVNQSGMYVIQSLGATDTSGALFSANYTALAADQDSGDGPNFLMRRQLTAGDYYIQVRGFNSSVTGAYSVRVSAE